MRKKNKPINIELNFTDGFMILFLEDRYGRGEYFRLPLDLLFNEPADVNINITEDIGSVFKYKVNVNNLTEKKED